MKRVLILGLLLAPALTGCQYDPFASGPKQPMYATGAPCGYEAVDAGICPKVGYRVPPGARY